MATSFTAQQLLLTARHLDYVDEMGRRQLVSLVLSFLPRLACGGDPSARAYEINIGQRVNVHGDLLDAALHALIMAQGNQTDFVRSVVERISDVRDPLLATQSVHLWCDALLS